MLLDKSKIKKILVISLTNIGDVILTFPVIDILKENFPSANLSVVVGPKVESLLKGNPNLEHVYIYIKRQKPIKTARWLLDLRKQKFDLVVDLRNTVIPFLTASKYKTPILMTKTNAIHMRNKHLQRLRSIFPFKEMSQHTSALFVPQEDQKIVAEVIKNEIGGNERFVVVGAGAANHSKRWSEEGFAKVCDELIEQYKLKIVFIGSREDKIVAQRIVHMMKHPSIDLCGRLTLTQLAEIFKHCLLTIVNDSAPLHLASYLDIPVLAIFGPTDPLKYGPWGSKSYFIKNKEYCAACQNPKKGLEHTCMNSIAGKDLLDAFTITPQGVVFKNGPKLS